MGTRVGWAALTAAWYDYLKAAGAPDTTIRLRIYHVNRLATEIGRTPGAVTFDQLVRWLSGKDWSPNTRRAYRSSLRSFYGWAVATGRVVESPAHLLPPVPIPRAKPRPAPEAAYREALLVADARSRLAIMLAAQCGLRRSEIARSRTDDMEADLLGWSLRVAGKGGHVRLVPLSEELAGLVHGAEAGWLFPSPRGGSHLTPHHLGKIVSRYLPGGLTTHTLRHRCATISYAATHDLRAVQELLGHAKPETTMAYTQVPDASIRAAMAAAAA